MRSAVVEVEGHIIDSLILAKVLDVILDAGGDYRVLDVEIGRTNLDASRARLEVTAPDDDSLAALVTQLQVHGANPVGQEEARTVAADLDGVLPPDFYSTTNLPTQVCLGGRWVDVENPEMDCAVVLTPEGRARTRPMHRVRADDDVVVGQAGVRVQPLDRPRGASPFEFMTSEVSSEKPKDLLVAAVAERMRLAKASGGRVLAVCGPAVVHTGASPAMVRLVRAGYVDVLFAGNALATHDIESALYGTSLGVDLAKGSGVPHGHEHHIRAINTIRAAGSIAAAVEKGVLTGGVMHAMVEAGKPYVLVGSVRDDGPLPDVYTDVIEGQRAMRAQLKDVGFCIMVATMLHSVATGNILPASIPLVCVDINPATVTKLADRGSSQARGIVTDVGLFLEQLAVELVPEYRTRRD